MRCHAFILEAEDYQDMEVQLLEQLKSAERQTLEYLLSDSIDQIELLSGEARVLFGAGDFMQHTDLPERRMRMAVAPDEMGEFVGLWSGEQHEERLAPISFNLPRLRAGLANADQVGLVLLEETEDWMWVEHPNEIIAVRDDAWQVLAPHLQALLQAGEHALLARLAADHSESAVEFTGARWTKFLEQLQHAAPEMLNVVQHSLSHPSDYVSIRELLALVAEPSVQPSLDAWLRVTEAREACGLYFRDAQRDSVD